MTSSTPPPERPPEPAADNEPAEPAAPATPPPYGTTPAGGQPDQPQYGQPPYEQPQYNQPQSGQPQYGQSQYGQPAYGTGGYGGAALRVERPGMTTTASITMIVLGALGVLFGLLVLLAGAFVSGAGNALDTQVPGFGGISGAVGGVLIVFALILLAMGILEIVAGAQVLSGRGWARITGIVLSVIWAFFSILGLFGESSGGGKAIDVVVLAANLFIIWALATTGSWFAARAR